MCNTRGVLLIFWNFVNGIVEPDGCGGHDGRAAQASSATLYLPHSWRNLHGKNWSFRRIWQPFPTHCSATWWRCTGWWNVDCGWSLSWRFQIVVYIQPWNWYEVMMIPNDPHSCIFASSQTTRQLWSLQKPRSDCTHHTTLIGMHHPCTWRAPFFGCKRVQSVQRQEKNYGKIWRTNKQHSRNEEFSPWWHSVNMKEGKSQSMFPVDFPGNNMWCDELGHAVLHPPIQGRLFFLSQLLVGAFAICLPFCWTLEQEYNWSFQGLLKIELGSPEVTEVQDKQTMSEHVRTPQNTPL